MRTSFHHQSEAQPPNGPLTAAPAPIPHLTWPATQSGLCEPRTVSVAIHAVLKTAPANCKSLGDSGIRLRCTDDAPCPVKGRRLSSNHIGLPQRENSETFRRSAYSPRHIENNRFSRRSFLRPVADLDDRVVHGNQHNGVSV